MSRRPRADRYVTLLSRPDPDSTTPGAARFDDAKITLGEMRSSGGPTSPICCLFWGENDDLSILPET